MERRASGLKFGCGSARVCTVWVACICAVRACVQLCVRVSACVWRAYIHGTLWLRRQWQNVRTRAYHSSEFLHDRQLHNPPESPTAHVRA